MPAFVLDMGGRQVSWHAAEARLHQPLPGWDRTATARLQRLWTGSGEVEISGTGVLLTLGPNARLQADVLSLGTPPAQVQLQGLWVEHDAGVLAITAQSIWATLLGERLTGEKLSTKAGVPGYGGIAGQVPPGGTVPLHMLSLEWGGARLTASGILGLADAGRPVFIGTAVLTNYAGALDRLVKGGNLGEDAARAVRAVLDVHASAKPPAPLAVTFVGGVLTIAGFPVWRAE